MTSQIKKKIKEKFEPMTSHTESRQTTSPQQPLLRLFWCSNDIILKFEVKNLVLEVEVLIKKIKQNKKLNRKSNQWPHKFKKKLKKIEPVTSQK